MVCFVWIVSYLWQSLIFYKNRTALADNGLESSDADNDFEHIHENSTNDVKINTDYKEILQNI